MTADVAENGTERPGRSVVKSADRAIDVIEVLSARGEMSLTELARHLSIPKSSLHGILATLERRRWVHADKAGNFHIGLRAVVAGTTLLERDEVVTATASLMDRLAEQTGETVQLARLDGDQVIYLAKRQSPHPVSLISSVGSRLPAHATSLGKALLSYRSGAELDAMLTFPLAAVTAQSVTNRQELLDELAQAREQGYAVDNEETADHLRCFAVALTFAEPPVDAISVSVPTFRSSKTTERKIIELLLELREQAGRLPRERR